MDYNFKRFEGRHSREEDRITITRSNSIGLPRKFYNDNNIKDYGFAILFWDEQKKAIGVQFTNDKGEKSKFSILRNKAGYGGGIIARSFFKSNKIDPNIYHGRYVWKKVNI